MRKLKPFIIVTLAFSVGFVAGGGWIFWRFESVSYQQWSTSTSIQSNMAVATLRSIRAGETNKAIERLEYQLDGLVLDLANICRECPRPETQTFPFQAVARARDYRTEFPRTTDDSIIDGLVAKAFTWADKAKEP